MWRIVVGIIVIIIVGAGVWFFIPGETNAPQTSQEVSTPSPTPEGSANVVAPTPPAAPPAPLDTSNAALDKDLGAMDAQLKGLSGDQSNIDQGLNDKPVSQEF